VRLLIVQFKKCFNILGEIYCTVIASYNQIVNRIYELRKLRLPKQDLMMNITLMKIRISHN